MHNSYQTENKRIAKLVVWHLHTLVEKKNCQPVFECITAVFLHSRHCVSILFCLYVKNICAPIHNSIKYKNIKYTNISINSFEFLKSIEPVCDKLKKFSKKNCKKLNSNLYFPRSRQNKFFVFLIQKSIFNKIHFYIVIKIIDCCHFKCNLHSRY